MTAAYRLKGAGWLLTCVGVALAFYLVSLRVADERKRVEQVNARIALAQRDIRALETEFDTRANLVQLERWNGDTLALAAPGAGQFVHDEAALAAIDVRGGPLAGAEVRTAALIVPAAAPPAVLPAAPAPALALAHAAPVTVPAAAAPARVAPSGGAAQVVQVASLHLTPSPAATRALARQEEAARGRAAVAKVRPQAVAMLDSKLLSDATLGDLLASARRESGRRR